ncbi:uncharacterized protein [Centruroides vittatus]|uniref:uncharacterized protein n=1 Tax=Centruroides vittatus TaxID=120091 RepID=UPI00350E9378
MKLLMLLFVLGATIFSVVSSYSSKEAGYHNSTRDVVRRFCALKNGSHFRYCLIVNGLRENIERYRNCAEQVKFFHILQEIDQFICKTRTEQEYEQFMKCFEPASNAANRNNPRIFPILEKCLQFEENIDVDKKYIYDEYGT